MITPNPLTIYVSNPEIIPPQFVLSCEWEQWCISDTCNHVSHGEGAHKTVITAVHEGDEDFDRDEYEAGYSHIARYRFPDGRLLRVRVEKHHADQVVGV